MAQDYKSRYNECVADLQYLSIIDDSIINNQKKIIETKDSFINFQSNLLIKYKNNYDTCNSVAQSLSKELKKQDKLIHRQRNIIKISTSTSITLILLLLIL